MKYRREQLEPMELSNVFSNQAISEMFKIIFIRFDRR